MTPFPLQLSATTLLLLAPSVALIEAWLAPRKPFNGPPGNFHKRNRDQDVNALWNHTSAADDDMSGDVERVEDTDDFDMLLESLGVPTTYIEASKERIDIQNSDETIQGDTDEQQEAVAAASADQDDGTEKKEEIDPRYKVKGLVFIGEPGM